MSKAPGKIHISFDGWRSSNRHSLYGIRCFYRDEESQLHKIVLGLPEAIRHSGPEIASHVLDALMDFQITHKIGYSTLDNASNNDSALKVIGTELASRNVSAGVVVLATLFVYQQRCCYLAIMLTLLSNM